MIDINFNKEMFQEALNHLSLIRVFLFIIMIQITFILSSMWSRHVK